MLDLYARVFDGQPLGEDEYVISSDEKTPTQARCRCHPTLAPGQARAMHVNHDCQRGGALAYLAAYDVHHAKVFGCCEPKTGIVPFMNLVNQVMITEPCATGPFLQAATAVVPDGHGHRNRLLLPSRDLIVRRSSCEPCGLLVAYAWGDVRVARDI